MKLSIAIFPIMILGVMSMSVATAGIRVVECEDEHGDRTFQTTCPPNSKLIKEKNIVTESSRRNAKSANFDAEITLYYVPGCDSCDDVREFLQNRKLSFSSKDVSNDLALQQKLTELAGSLKVPVLAINDEIVTGYSRDRLKGALKAAGYVPPEEQIEE